VVSSLLAPKPAAAAASTSETAEVVGNPEAAAPDAGNADAADELPPDMSTTSLVGGGLIAGESLYALGAGLASLFGSMLLGGK
jgi:hypothetical protein